MYVTQISTHRIQRHPQIWVSCPSTPQEKKQRPTETKLSFCNGMKQLRGCLNEELLPVW